MTISIPDTYRVELTALLDNAETALDQFVEARSAKAVRRAIDQRIAALQIELAKIFRRQGSALAKALAPLGKYLTEAVDADLNRLFDKATLATSTDMVDTIQDAIEAALLAGANQIIQDFNPSIAFSLTNPRAVAYTGQYAAKLITGIDRTSRDHIRQLVNVAISNGTSYAQLARQLKATYRQFAIGVPQQHIRSRAELIAITEIGNAYCEGNLIAARLVEADGIPLEKLWQTVGDARVSAGCRDNSAAGWIPLDDDFVSGHDRPLRFPGCRCTALYRRKK